MKRLGLIVVGISCLSCSAWAQNAPGAPRLLRAQNPLVEPAAPPGIVPTPTIARPCYRRPFGARATLLARSVIPAITLRTDDLDRESMVAALKAFARKADAADLAIVYYAGHGIEIGGTNYLIPIDAKDRSRRSP